MAHTQVPVTRDLSHMHSWPCCNPSRTHQPAKSIRPVANHQPPSPWATESDQGPRLRHRSRFKVPNTDSGHFENHLISSKSWWINGWHIFTFFNTCPPPLRPIRSPILHPGVGFSGFLNGQVWVLRPPQQGVSPAEPGGVQIFISCQTKITRQADWADSHLPFSFWALLSPNYHLHPERSKPSPKMSPCPPAKKYLPKSKSAFLFHKPKRYWQPKNQSESLSLNRKLHLDIVGLGQSPISQKWMQPFVASECPNPVVLPRCRACAALAPLSAAISAADTRGGASNWRQLEPSSPTMPSRSLGR